MSYICTQSVDNGSRFIVLVCIFVSAFLGLYGHDWLAGSMVAIIATVGTILFCIRNPIRITEWPIRRLMSSVCLGINK